VEAIRLRLYYTPMPEPATRLDEAEAARTSVHFDTRPPELTRWQRMQIPAIGWAGWSLVRMLGPTLRFEVHGYQHVERLHASGRPFISAFWHRVILPAIWWWRNRKIVVLNSTNFDGQWTRRVIERFGFLTAQGSSTRGGLRGLAVMARRLEEGRDVAFTIDGPRGPRYVAKPGPVMLSRRTGLPIMVFHIGLQEAWTLEKTWDLFQIPKPFSRAVLLIAPLIEVSPEADREEMERKHAEMQAALDRVREVSESWYRLPSEERARLAREWDA